MLRTCRRTQYRFCSVLIGLPWWPRGGLWVACLQHGRPGFDPWVGKIRWRRKRQPTPVFLPGESHGRRSLVGYCPWGRKESDTTEQFHTHTHSVLIKMHKLNIIIREYQVKSHLNINPGLISQLSSEGPRL